MKLIPVEESNHIERMERKIEFLATFAFSAVNEPERNLK
jgi:hypothetical protein